MTDAALVRGHAQVDAAESAHRLNRVHPDGLRAALLQCTDPVLEHFTSQRTATIVKLEAELLHARFQHALASAVLHERHHEE